jgi:hypothetical protein
MNRHGNPFVSYAQQKSITLPFGEIMLYVMVIFLLNPAIYPIMHSISAIFLLGY